MKVHELIALLEECDPEADVFIGHQPSYPFEFTVAGITERRDFASEALVEELEYHLPEDLDEREAMVTAFEDDPDYGTDWRGRQLSGSDVLILDGEQVRYGEAAAWEARR